MDENKPNRLFKIEVLGNTKWWWDADDCGDGILIQDEGWRDVLEIPGGIDWMGKPGPCMKWGDGTAISGVKFRTYAYGGGDWKDPDNYPYLMREEDVGTIWYRIPPGYDKPFWCIYGPGNPDEVEMVNGIAGHCCNGTRTNVSCEWQWPGDYSQLSTKTTVVWDDGGSPCADESNHLCSDEESSSGS